MMTKEEIDYLRRKYPDSLILKGYEADAYQNTFGGVTVRPNAFFVPPDESTLVPATFHQVFKEIMGMAKAAESHRAETKEESFPIRMKDAASLKQKEFDFMKEAEVEYVPSSTLRGQTIYVMAKMRGTPYYNYPLIDAAARRLERLGWIVKSPVDMDRERGFDAMKLPADTDWSKWPKGLDHRSTVDHCLSTITHDVSAVYVATNEIELGPGGQAELAVARWLGLKEYHAERGDVPTICGQPVTLLGICGKAGSGKDTMRAYVEEAIFDSWDDFSVDRYSFADPMRKIAINVFGFTEDQLLDPKMKEVVDSFWDVTPRKFMQLLGTDMFRNHLRDDVWLKQAERHLDGLSGDIVTIIADVRFENEADWIKKNGGVLLKIEGRESSTTGGESKAHVSEQGTGNVEPDFVFKNVGPLQDMKRFAAGIAELMRQGRREAPCGLGVKS